ncbi:hypothetical protein [[Clostridium] symbiosum]|uniref:hypothetical protein n=1 Tax=Clostridium symbiosum TaxID=1512 RepID=UPI001231B1D5|nr:hypothetical protein [[Clostridium] symbiosum]KAA6136210.1 hypothetical protein F2P57_23045 [[Clostridium] symbiosum]MCR1941130.1 hypothetical protein [[Clostridium] symbiosum]
MVFIGNYSEMISIGYDVGVKRSFDPFDTGLLRTACSHNPQKHSQSAHFSAKNGFLLMFLAGPKIKNLHASKLASDFQPFDPGIRLFIKKVGTLPERPADGVVGVYMSLSPRGWIVVVWGCGRR